ncbi:MAG: hypothetical protein EOP50_18805 [Sphingobacteriales bacterium]|nr:MAG: hypothetical protein EOP50_18805 [Sphingobacteriales bacterium]
MSDTVKPMRTYLLTSPVPARSYIHSQMAMRFSGASMLVHDIIAPCAEMAERMMLELARQEDRPSIALRKVRHGGGSHHLRKSGYTCPACRWDTVRLHDRFCAGCGRAIEWGDPGPIKSSL